MEIALRAKIDFFPIFYEKERYGPFFLEIWTYISMDGPRQVIIVEAQ
jgi:hypothetical protein